MDSVSSLTPKLRIDKLRFAQGNRQQHQPFSRGQILQGRITGKENNQFILDVKGQQFLADSRASLQVGQRLQLQVTELSPRITLQVLTDPLTRNIGKSLHLLSTEGKLLRNTAALAADLSASTLSPTSRQTLEFFASLAPAGTRSTTPQEDGGRLVRLLADLFSSSDMKTEGMSLVRLQTIIDHMSQTLPRQHPARESVQALQRELTGLGRNTSLLQLMTGKATPEVNPLFNTLLSDISGFAGPEMTGQSLSELILGFMNRENSAPTPFLQHLLMLTKELYTQEPQGTQSTGEQKNLPDGKELEQFINRLGTNLEQLLATGRQEEAAQTLKSALLEISHTFADNTKIQSQADQLTAAIQLYQMLQIRLAGEALFFMPLPLSFLDRGFLLVEPDHKQQEQRQAGSENNKYSLHLNLEGLGNLQIDLQQQSGSTRIRFYAEDSDKAKFLSENREDLQNRLTATTLESVQFLTGAEDPTRQLLARMSHGSASLLNTRA